MKQFYVANRAGVPVHVRIDDADGSVGPAFRITISDKAIAERPRPLTAFILSTTMPYRVRTLDGPATHEVVDRTGARLTYEEYVDTDGDTILKLTGLVN